MKTLKKSAKRHKFNNISLKRWLLKIGRIRRRGLLQKFKAQLVGLEIPDAAVRKGLLQISTHCSIRLNRILANETPWICHSEVKESGTEKSHSYRRSACDRPSSSLKKSHHRPYREDTDTTVVNPISKNSDSQNNASISTQLSEFPTAADRSPRLKNETSVGSTMGIHCNGSTSGQRRLSLESERIPHNDENISHHPRKADDQLHIHGSNEPDRRGGQRSRSTEKSKRRRLTSEIPNNIAWRLIPIDEQCIRKPPHTNILEWTKAIKRKEKLSQKYVEIFGEDELSRFDPSEMSISLTESSDQNPDSSNESWYITGIQISKIHETPKNRKSPIFGPRNKRVNLPKQIRTAQGIEDRENSRTEVTEKKLPAAQNRIVIQSAQDGVSPTTDDRCNTTIPALTFSSCFPIKSPKRVDVKDEKDHVVEISKKKLRSVQNQALLQSSQDKISPITDDQCKTCNLELRSWIYDCDTVDQKSAKGVTCEPSTTLELEAETFSIDSNKIMDYVTKSKIKDNDMGRCNDNDVSESLTKPISEKDIKPTYEFCPNSKTCKDAEATKSRLAQTTCQLSKLLTGWGISHVSSRLLGATDVIYLTLLGRRRLMERRQAANQLAVRKNRQKELLTAQHEFKSHIQKFLDEFMYLHQKLGERSRVLQFIMLGLRNRIPAGSQPFAKSELDFLITAANIDDFTNCEEQVLLTEMKSSPRNEEPSQKVICEIDLTIDEADQANTVDLICDSSTDLQWHCEVKGAYDLNANELPLQVPNIAEVKSISRQQFETLNEKEKIKSPCFMCGKESTVSCGQCVKTNYCSEDCQRIHWEVVHHTTCVPRLGVI